jgi:Asp-tRNA(Asn)/Glu-tRNA(Gln) amidotransferase A subunit family amidase
MQARALHGIPYGAKDVFATAGIATTGHSKAYVDSQCALLK